MRIIIFSIGFTDTTLAHARSICNESEVILFGAKKESTYFSDTRDDLYDKLPDNIKVEKFFDFVLPSFRSQRIKNSILKDDQPSPLPTSTTRTAIIKTSTSKISVPAIIPSYKL